MFSSELPNFTGTIKKKENSEFENEYEVTVPSEREVRIVGNK